MDTLELGVGDIVEVRVGGYSSTDSRRGVIEGETPTRWKVRVYNVNGHNYIQEIEKHRLRSWPKSSTYSHLAGKATSEQIAAWKEKEAKHLAEHQAREAEKAAKEAKRLDLQALFVGRATVQHDYETGFNVTFGGITEKELRDLAERVK